jgi:hypothetical protein
MILPLEALLTNADMRQLEPLKARVASSPSNRDLDVILRKSDHRK